jgi:sugar phosphate isomerase/epimerase
VSDWPIGISTGCFYYASIFDCLEDIRKGGFCMIEVCSSPGHLDYHDEDAVREAASLIDELGMEPYSFHAPFSEDIDITCLDDTERDRSYHEILAAAEAAAMMRVRHFVFHPGPEKVLEPEPEERLQRMNNAAEVLNDVSRRCKQLGVGFVLENMLPHLLFGNARDMLWIMGAIQTINVGTCLDTGHASLSGDIYSVMYKLSGHLQMIHANDNRGKGDDHLPPGRGIINWQRLLARLSETGFHGAFILELAGDEEKEAEETLEEARAARRLLRDISKHIELSTPPTVVRAALGDNR